MLAGDPRRRAHAVAAQRGVTVDDRADQRRPARDLRRRTIVDAIDRRLRDSAALRHQRMISRAYHDSLFMSRIAPTAMIFIPCRGGVSHRPDEYSSPEQIASGVDVLADTLLELST